MTATIISARPTNSSILNLSNNLFVNNNNNNNGITVNNNNSITPKINDQNIQIENRSKIDVTTSTSYLMTTFSTIPVSDKMIPINSSFTSSSLSPSSSLITSTSLSLSLSSSSTETTIATAARLPTTGSPKTENSSIFQQNLSSQSSSTSSSLLTTPTSTILSTTPLRSTSAPRQVTTIPVQTSRTTATIVTSNKRPTIIIYPTVSPESIVIPIVSCIFCFPLLALMVICCLRRRAKLARERDRRRNYDMQDHAVSLVRFSPIHRLNNRSSRAISLRPERSLSRGFPSLELDTVIEERSDPEQTQTDIISPESPLDPNKYRDFNSS